MSIVSLVLGFTARASRCDPGVSFDPTEPSTCPCELDSKDAEAGWDHKNRWPRSDDHDNPDEYYRGAYDRDCDSFCEAEGGGFGLKTVSFGLKPAAPGGFGGGVAHPLLYKERKFWRIFFPSSVRMDSG